MNASKKYPEHEIYWLEILDGFHKCFKIYVTKLDILKFIGLIKKINNLNYEFRAHVSLTKKTKKKLLMLQALNS